MTHPDTAHLFDLLDRWRHLPSYRLEPRTDPVFALFLPGALNRHLRPRGIDIDPRIIPEFPLKQARTRRSDKADFFAVSTDRRHAFLIELKTDERSFRERQQAYLRRAVERGLAAVLHDIKSIAKAKDPQVRRKYFHLLKAIAALDLMSLPPELEGKIFDLSQGVHACIDRIGIPSTLPDIEVIHILPKAEHALDCIDFASFADAVQHQGKIGRRFAASLRAWARVNAGGPHEDSPGCA